MDFDISTVAHALLGATIADVLARVAWLVCGCLLTALGFWGWRKRMVAMERRTDQIGAPAQPMAVHQPVEQTVNVGTADDRSDTRSSVPESESLPWATSYASWSCEPCNGRRAAILIVRAPSMHDTMTVLDEFCLADDRTDADLAYFAMFYRSSEEADENVDADDRIPEIAQRIIEWNHDEDGLAFAANHFRDRSHPDVRYLIEMYERENMDV